MADPIRLLITEGAASPFVRHLGECSLSNQFHLLIRKDDSEAALCAAAVEADAILCYQAQLPASVIRAAPSLKFIQKHGLNCRNIDVAAATDRHVPLATLSLMRSVTVAEHALALILACARKIIPGHQAVTAAVYREMGLEPVATSQGNYRPNWSRIKGINEIFQSTVGIVGMGDIGMEIARRCRAFGMRIVYFQRTRHPAAIDESLGMQYQPFDELLAQSDYVVLVIPHTPQTDGLMGAREFARMKPSATLINIGRGALVDEAALVAALRGNLIAMAGLDVYRTEPLPADSPLLTLPNVVFQPHTGGGSYRTWEMDIPAVLGNIQAFFDSGRADGIVNDWRGVMRP